MMCWFGKCYVVGGDGEIMVFVVLVVVIGVDGVLLVIYWWC